MTQEQGGSHTPGTCGLAQFFFEVGYGSCYAYALIANDMKPPFAYSDAAVERAWQIAPEAHEDGPEFNRYSALADAAPELLEALEAICAEADRMSMTMRRRKIFDAGKAAIAKAQPLPPSDVEN